MPDRPSLTIIKGIEYRDVTEEYSNTYHFWLQNGNPDSAAAWMIFATMLMQHEQPIHTTETTFHRVYGHNAGQPGAVFMHDWLGAGNPPVGTAAYPAHLRVPGDTAAWIRWSTGQRNSRGKLIYLRKYFHKIPSSAATDVDHVLPEAVQAMHTFGEWLLTGPWNGAQYCSPQGVVPIDVGVSQYQTTRTLKRRGRRPPS